MGFEEHETNDLFRLVAGIMHMGEMKFKQRPREEQAEIDGEYDAENACYNFNVDHEAFLKSMVKPRVRVGTEWVNKGQNIDQVGPLHVGCHVVPPTKKSPLFRLIGL